MKKMTRKEQDLILKAAMENIYHIGERGSLETRHSDGEDFFDISVWELKAALEAAYELGRRSAMD